MGYDENEDYSKLRRLSVANRLRRTIQVGTEWKAYNGFWFVVTPDPKIPGNVRILYYDRDGFSGHASFNGMDELVDYLISRDQLLERADGSLERFSNTDRWKRGMDMQARRNPPHDYVYWTDCVSSSGELINEMRWNDLELQVTYETMLAHADGLLSWARSVGYESRVTSGSGITLRKDPLVSFHRSFYCGVPCYYVAWSGIEHVWIKKGFENEVSSCEADAKSSDLRRDLPGGLAEKQGLTPSDFDPMQLAAGIKVEMEHTSDWRIARQIAMDHLAEDPDYYIKLETIEMHDNPLTPEAHAFESTPCALTRPVGHCPDDRAGVHFAVDWGLAARYAIFKAGRTSSVGIVLEYDLSGLELVPDHDAFVEKTYGDFTVGDLSYYIDEFDILSDPEDPDYDRLAELMESEAEMLEPEPQSPPWSVEKTLVDNAKGSIFSILADKLRGGYDDAELALKAIQTGDVPLAWWAESIGQVRTFETVGDQRLLRVSAMKPIKDDIEDDYPDEYVDECPEALYMDDLDNLADRLEDMAVVLWTSPRRDQVQEVHYHGTDLTRAKVILKDASASLALTNPWAPCVQGGETDPQSKLPSENPVSPPNVAKLSTVDVRALNELEFEAMQASDLADRLYELGLEEEAEDYDAEATELLDRLEAMSDEILEAMEDEEQGGGSEQRLGFQQDPQDFFMRAWASWLFFKENGWVSGGLDLENEAKFADWMRSALKDEYGPSFRAETTDAELLAAAEDVYNARIEARLKQITALSGSDPPMAYFPRHL